MDWFLIVSLIMIVIMAIWSIVIVMLFIQSRRKKKTTFVREIQTNPKVFRKEVEESYKKQICLVNSGDIKMNILTNDSNDDNEMLIMNNLKK